MKYWMIVVLFLFGALAYMTGAMAKITHVHIFSLSADLIISLGFLIKGLAIVLLIVKVVMNRKKGVLAK